MLKNTQETHVFHLGCSLLNDIERVRKNTHNYLINYLVTRIGSHFSLSQIAVWRRVL